MLLLLSALVRSRLDLTVGHRVKFRIAERRMSMEPGLDSLGSPFKISISKALILTTNTTDLTNFCNDTTRKGRRKHFNVVRARI